MKEDIVKLQMAVASQQSTINNLVAAVNKLGGLSGLEWLESFNDWVSKEKIEALKRNPR